VRGLIGPSILIEPGRRIAPRPIIGFGDVPIEPGHHRLGIDPLHRPAKRLERIGLADLVRILRPERLEFARAGNTRLRWGFGEEVIF
jgi:hypothetical protein